MNERQDNSWRLKLPALKTAIRVGGFLPRLPAYALARLAGDAAFRFRHSTREDVRDNMRHVMGPTASQAQIDAAAREAFRNVARYYVDLVRLPRMGLEKQIGKQVTLHGFDILKSRLDRGEGCVVATAHFGNPELAVQVGAILGIDMLVLAEPLQPREFSDTMLKLRGVFGTRYEDVGFGAVAAAIRHLRTGGCLAITFDRDIQGNGTPLSFFGAVTRVPLGAVELATRTGAHLIPGYCRRVGGGFEIHFEEPMELIKTERPREDALVNGRRLLERGEAWIASDPGQWMVLECIWKPVPEAAEPPLPIASRPD